MYLLDTNVIVYYLNKKSPAIINKLKTIAVRDIFVCSIVKAELYYGANKSNNPEKILNKQKIFLDKFISLDFDDESANLYGIIRANLEKKGTPIGANDLLIASIAMRHNLILVTHNTREFKRIDGLLFEDWQEE